MATLSTNALTLLDWAKRLDPNGRTAAVAEVLSQTNEMLDDGLFMESNLPTGHKATIRTGLPTVYWRALNQGVPRSKSTTAEVTETIGMLEAYSVTDVDLAALNGNTSSFRLSEDRPFIEAMNQAQASAAFYANPATDPRSYLGLAPRYGSLSAGNALNILDAGGTSSANTSIWLVGWGEDASFFTFPKGSKAGLMSQDMGQLTVYDSLNNPYQGLQSHYQWKNGLVVKDWRTTVRVANIDTATFAAMSGTQATTAVATNLIHMMTRALDRVPNLRSAKYCFYMNRSSYSLLRRLALEKSINALAIETGKNQFGTAASWASFEGVPLRRVDAILNTEARVV